jgi:hypothetical protein
VIVPKLVKVELKGWDDANSGVELHNGFSASQSDTSKRPEAFGKKGLLRKFHSSPNSIILQTRALLGVF